MTGQRSSSSYPPWPWEIDPAPGDLRIVQAFVNTLDVEADRDEIADAGGLAAWLGRWGLGESRAATESDRAEALELREGLRELLLANADDEHPPDAASLGALEGVLRRMPLRCLLEPDGSYRLVADGGAWHEAVARLLTIVTRAMGRGTWRRLKVCGRDDCRWAFYDSSRNRSGRWCSMQRCGNVMKARAYRARKRAEASGS